MMFLVYTIAHSRVNKLFLLCQGQKEIKKLNILILFNEYLKSL